MFAIAPQKIIYGTIFLPIIFFIGIITAFEDFKDSKIKNKWILAGLIYASIIYFLFWILYGLAVRKITGPFIGGISSYLIWNFDKWCINLLISIIVAYLLWHFKLWAAGDAKLFICYSAFIPMGQYSKIYFNYYFASFLLLLTIFIPATIFLFLRAIIYFIKKFNLNRIKENIPRLFKEKLVESNKKDIGKVFLGFFVFFLFFKVLRQEFTNLISKFLPNQNILILVFLLVFKQLSKFFRKNIKFMVSAFILLIVYLVFKIKSQEEQFILEIGNTFIRVLSIMILFPIFKKIVDLYGERITQKTTPFAIWMFLGALIAWFL